MIKMSSPVGLERQCREMAEETVQCHQMITFFRCKCLVITCRGLLFYLDTQYPRYKVLFLRANRCDLFIMWTFSSGCSKTIRFAIIKCGEGGKQIKTGIRNSWHVITISVFIGTSVWFYLMLVFGTTSQAFMTETRRKRSEPGPDSQVMKVWMNDSEARLPFHVFQMFFTVHRNGGLQP